MRRPYSVWCNNSRQKSYIPVVSPTSVFTEDMRTPYSVWCNFSQNYFFRIFFPNSVLTEYIRPSYSVWCNNSRKKITYLLFLLFQFLQRTCEQHTQYDAIFLRSTFYRPVVFHNSIQEWTCNGHTLCDAITLEKKLTNLLFLLFQFLQRKCEQHTQCDAFFLRRSFYRPVLFHKSVLTVDMRGPYSVWCNISGKNLWYLLFLLHQFLQRTCEQHTQCDAIFLRSTFYRPVIFPNSVIAEDIRRPYSVCCNNSR